MDIEQAIKLLRENYAKAQNAPFVQKPLAYAMYRTWKTVDKAEAKRKKPQEVPHE